MTLHSEFQTVNQRNLELHSAPGAMLQGSEPRPSVCNLDEDYSAIQEFPMHPFHGVLGFILVGVRQERETSRPLRNSIHHEMNFGELTKLLERLLEALFGCTERETADVQPGGGAVVCAQRLDAGGGGGQTLPVADPTGGGRRTKRA
uniref:Uncharacterized protein n=1 Tax=Arundo donax TaxID=35708 RepID=A0A0A9G8N8_ARUDO